jgi:(1->4)-alpha-D-glucan 1-alpha-D-glucosylmutase
MRTALASELTVLSNRLWRIAQSDRGTRDFTLNNLRQALLEVVASFPVYRTYVTHQASPDDRRFVQWAVSQARRRSRAADASIFDFVLRTLLGEAREGSPVQQVQDALGFARRFQQFTAPVMAKGVEDTASYVYHRLASLNEVGGDPTCFGVTVPSFHRTSEDRAAKWPFTMLATSTHDNKRSEDVRARINVLSEVPAAWRLNLRRWSRLNRSRKVMVEGKRAPSANDEYLLYQTLVGSWPLGLLSDERLGDYRARVHAYMTKAVREAKVETSWINVNAEYEAALAGFIDALLGRMDGNLFLDDLLPFQRTMSWLGMLNSLSQSLIKLTSPGVPDTYQGNELWDYSLVDPDNRRSVDYALRTKLLADVSARFASPGRDFAAMMHSMMSTPEDGRLKLFVTWRALQMRAEHVEVFRNGDYLPLSAVGTRKEHVVAYARRAQNSGAVVVVGRLFAGLGLRVGELPVGEGSWEDTSIDAAVVPAGATLVNALTGRTLSMVVEQQLVLRDVFADLPVALLYWRVTP